MPRCAWCAACDRWIYGPAEACPRCAVRTGDEVAVGLRVVVERSADRRGLGWPQCERFVGRVVAVRDGLDPCVDVERDDGVVVGRVHLGSTRPDSFAAREQAAVRAALMFVARL